MYIYKLIFHRYTIPKREYFLNCFIEFCSFSFQYFKKCKVRLWTKVFSLCRYRPQSSFAQSKTSKKMILLHNIVSHLLSKAIYNIHCNLPVCLFQICLNISAAFWISYISFWNKCLILCRSIAPFTNLFSLQKCWF